MIVLTANNRPGYLRTVLESWAQVRGVEGHRIVVQSEPPHDDTLRVCRDFDLDLEARRNREQLGVRDNPFRLLEWAFEAEPFVVYSEEDIVVSDDCLEYAEWAREHLHDAVSVVGFKQQWLTPGPSEHPNSVRLVPHFSANGLGIWADAWEFMRSLWYTDSRGWDWSITSAIGRGEWTTAVPSYSRSNHIGRIGTYTTPEQFDAGQDSAPTFRPHYAKGWWSVVG